MEQQYKKEIKEAQTRKERTLQKLRKQLRAEIFANAVRLEVADRGALSPQELTRTELIGILVRHVRLFKELSESELARMSGISLETISRVETGKHLPRHGTVEKLAKALGVPRKQLDPDFVFARWPAVYQTIVSEREVVEEREKVEAN